ncbi:MAG: energy transducer TonB [Candidatus Sulfotelmatobacter sp.]
MFKILRQSTVQGALLLAALLVLIPLHTRAQESVEVPRKILTRVAPKYPAVAHNMEIQGSVKAEALVEPNGRVKSVEIKGGHPILAQAAMEAVREWKWEPSSKETRELVEIKFVWQ